MVSLTQEQQMIVSSAADLAENEFADDAGTWGGELPWENAETLADNGFLGLNIDEEYGGAGMSEFEAMLVIDTVGQFCPDTGYLLNLLHFFPLIVQKFGSEAVKELYLPRVAAGEEAIATAISEPEAGSDVLSMGTTVRENNGNLVLDGQKTWISDLKDSSAVVVWVMFEGEGLGSVIVDKEMDGVNVGEHFTNMAGHIQSQLYLDEVIVPVENVLVRGNFADQFQAINWERLGNGAMLNGMMGFAARLALDYAGDRVQFDQPVVDFQGIEWKFADIVKQLEASRTLAMTAGRKAADRGGVPDRLESAIATLYASETAEQVVSEALQIHGANGYQQGHPLEYLYRFVRGFRIGAGTDEIQKNQIAEVVKQRGIPTLE